MNMLSKQFTEIRSKLTDKNYLIATIIYSISPTTAMLKPSCLLNFSKSGRNLLATWKKYKDMFANDPVLEFVELKTTPSYSSVLFYNEALLYAQIFNRNNMLFLQRFGYHQDMSLEEILCLLKIRFSSSYPHEVGIFLGIPKNDVSDFIENRGHNYLLCGYWKVYSNVSTAIKAFSAYNQAKEKALQDVFGVILQRK